MGNNVKNKVFSNRGEQDTTNIGTANTGVTATSWTEGRDIVTVLTFTGLTIATVTGGGTAAYGKLLYTFPAGTHITLATFVSVSFIHAVANAAIKVGVGSIIASGAVGVLSGTSAFMDYVTEQNTESAAGGGAVTNFLLTTTAGVLAGIALNKAADTKTVHLNVADVWPAGPNTDLTVTGTVTIRWTKMG